MDQGLLPLVQDPTGELSLLNEITQKINLGTSLEEVLDLIFARLREFIPYSRIALALLSADRERLTVNALRSDEKVVLARGYSGPVRGSSLEPLLQDGTIRIIGDLAEYLARNPASESTRLIVKEGMRSSLTLPLLMQGQPVGVVFFSSRQAHVYQLEHELFLRSIVGHMAIAVERTRLMDALWERTRSLENVLQNSADSIVVLDSEERIVTWSEGARRIFGWEAPELTGRGYDMLVPAARQAREEYAELLRKVARDGYVKDWECVRVGRDGRRILVNLTTTLLRDERGKNLGRSAVMRDVTHIKRLQEDLVRSRSLAAVGELAATVAHEIKNPLAAISGAVQVLEDAIPVQDRRRPVVGEILEQIRRLDKTVRDLLTFSRPMTPDRRTIDLRETLMRAWTLLSQQAGAERVRFVFEGDGSMTVPADPDLLHQVWINVLQNAVEAMSAGGDLRVVAVADDGVRVSVSDTGCGIDADQVPRLFRPFFTTKTRGTGLGLAISRKILEAHGGTIRVDSVSGKGTTITMEIPR